MSVSEWNIGYSVLSEPLRAWKIGTQGPSIHFYGGFHGDEPEGVALALSLKDYLIQNADRFQKKTLIVVPIANPDGFKNQTRVNAHKVDLNRNFPTKDWTSKASQPKYYPGPNPGSEPEVQAFVNLIQESKPHKIISFHSLNPHQINYDGPAHKLAHAMAKHNGYPVTEDIGYSTPGSLGSYAGREKKIAVITYELPEKISPEKAWKESVEAILEAIRF
ncbi:MAG: murein peptide amidase A [Deltaproteobacteria bacterium]|nr:murein peptide amidase A [Deltaproteobacteria bacterium]